MSAAPSDVFSDVYAELASAIAKFPTWPTDPLHALAVLGEEFGELTKDVLQMTYEPGKTNAGNVRKEAIQTAAMALRFAASLDAYQYKPGEQHRQPQNQRIPIDENIGHISIPSGLHPDTAQLVQRFASALAMKLSHAERKYGYSNRWKFPDWMDECRANLLEHLDKGDPRDVAAYCAFLWHHGAKTAAASQLARCTRPEGCVCGGDLPAIRETCGHWQQAEGQA